MELLREGYSDVLTWMGVASLVGSMFTAEENGHRIIYLYMY